MIEVRLANNEDEELLNKLNLKIEEIFGNFCFLYIDDLKPNGYCIIKTNDTKANVEDFYLNKDDSKKLFFLKSIGMNLRDFGIDEFFDEKGLAKSFFDNDGEIDFDILFRGFCDDLQ